MDDQQWTVEMVDSIAVLRFANPPMNYLGGAGLHQFGKALDQARRSNASVIVVASAVPGQFITHFSVEDIVAGQEKLLERGPLGNQRAQLLLERMAELTQPVIAAMSGDTMGFGLELALACDFRIVEQGDVQIGFPEVRMGIIPGAGGTQRAARLVGMARALDLVLRSRMIGPDEAVELGLVHQAAPDAFGAAMELARELAQLPASAVAAAKGALYGGRDVDMLAALRVERDASYRAKLLPDATKLMQEFVALPLDERRAWIRGGRNSP